MTDGTQQADLAPGTRARRAARFTTSALLTVGALACAPTDTDPSKLPPETLDPSTVQTAAGALTFHRRVLTLLPPSFDRFVTETGVFTDELAGMPGFNGTGGAWTAMDSRLVAPDFYNRFHHLRGQAREARGFLAAYALDADSTEAYNERDLRAQLFALEGYAEVFLDDFYCSGMPLSTIDFQGDYTLTPGYSTNDVYLHAAELFDSALALVSDSVERFQPLAAIGKGRALLGAGRFAEAAGAVAGVPDGYQYQVSDDGADFYDSYRDSRIMRNFASEFDDVDPVTGLPHNRNTPGMGDREGEDGQGLPYVTSLDPRTPALDLGPGPVYGGTMYFPANYPLDGTVTLTLASAVEARLIEAEAALQAPEDGMWLQRLNQLRQTVGLANTTDPGAALAGSDPAAARRVRVDLVFRERAFWLYLSGHRQGDLRRLIRQYGRPPNAAYPSGEYPGGTGRYGEMILAPVPETEARGNPKYTGCIHRLN